MLEVWILEKSLPANGETVLVISTPGRLCAATVPMKRISSRSAMNTSNMFEWRMLEMAFSSRV